MRSVLGIVRRVSFLSFGLFVVLAGSGCTKKQAGEASFQKTSESRALAVAPGIRLESMGGKTIQLSDFRGKPVVLHFWASWCPPCLPELPHVIAFASKVQSKGLNILAISTDTEWAKVKQALPQGQALPSNLIVLLDRDSKVAEAYGTYMYPESYWITPEGQIQHKWVGPQDWELLAERPL